MEIIQGNKRFVILLIEKANYIKKIYLKNILLGKRRYVAGGNSDFVDP